MGKQVLLVDDNPDNRELLFYALKTTDYEIMMAATAAEANALLNQKTFDLALLDVGLPDGSGLDIAETLRQKVPCAVIVILSAIDNPYELSRSAKIGVNAYIVKPFNLIQVLGLVDDINNKTVTAETKMKVMKG
jgi:DNA-binding response OmpR family regulator